MVGGRCGRAPSLSAGSDARGRAVAGRKNKNLFLHPDPNTQSAAAQTQEKPPDPNAATKRRTPVDDPPQTQIISDARPGRGRNTPDKRQKTFAFAKPDRDPRPDARGIARTHFGLTVALAQPGGESRHRLA